MRIAAFGNSFVYGNEVEDEAAWPAVMEQMFPDVEVLNYGVGGYGTDQALLRYEREGADLRPHVVVIGFVPVNLRRTVSVFRRFISTHGPVVTKPRFSFSDEGELVLHPNPMASMRDWELLLEQPGDVRRLGVNDHWYEPAIYENPLYDLSAAVRLGVAVWIRVKNRYWDPDRLIKSGVFNKDSRAFKIQIAIVERFVQRVVESGAHPTVVMFPDREVVVDAMRGQMSVYQPMTKELAARNIEVHDLTAAFTAAGQQSDIPAWFMPGGHYSPTGNRIVARWLGSQLLVRFRR